VSEGVSVHNLDSHVHVFAHPYNALMLTIFSPLKPASDQNTLKKGMSNLNRKKVAVGQNDIKKRQVQRSYFMYQILWSICVGGVN